MTPESCPFEDLAAYLEDRLPAARREAVETHALTCPACLETLRTAASHGQARPARAGWLAAAAALLLLAGLGAWRLSRPGIPFPPSPPLAVPVPISALRLLRPGETWECGEALAGRAILLELEPGGLAKCDKGELLLERGLLRIETPGEALVLRIGGLKAEMSQGILLAEALPVKTSGLFREALAGEAPGARITLLSGSVRLETPEGSLTLQPGQSYGGAPLAWPGKGVWTILAERQLSFRESSRTLLASPPAGGYLFEALVRKRQESAELGIRFAAGGKGWEVPVGANLLPTGEGWSRLRISAGSSACAISLGGRSLLSLLVLELSRNVVSAPSPEVALRAWGGEIEIREARWRALP